MRKEAGGFEGEGRCHAEKQRPRWARQGPASPAASVAPDGAGTRLWAQGNRAGISDLRTGSESVWVVASRHVGEICYRSHWRLIQLLLTRCRLGVAGTGVGVQLVAQGSLPVFSASWCHAAGWLWQETYLLRDRLVCLVSGRRTWKNVSECVLLF